VSFVIAFVVTLFFAAIGTRTFFGVLRLFGLYTTVGECRAKVYVLFGRVIGVLDEPGLRLPIAEIGPRATLVSFFGKVHELDLRLDQKYLRSLPVNTEEGTPMGIGVWYEMRVSNPVSFLFENMDPAGSLQANVTNATVRCLSNMPLDQMLTSRHGMSRRVRAEVSPRSENWGYRLGSVYIRKVHFRDLHMIEQIEQKVVNRLRQVTSAIRQAGANQVDIIHSAAEKEAAVEFARAEAVRPKLVGEALSEISRDPQVLATLMEILETQRIVESKAELTLVPGGNGSLLPQLLASKDEDSSASPEPRRPRS
jgi:regulator of protease activity HflC (stomatin/prohibitin superfamily)